MISVDSQFYSEARDLFPYLQTIRRDLHRHPELAFQEIRTAGVVVRELNQLGLEVTSGVAKTGVVALLEGNRPGPTILLRFDMDALPIYEETGAEYASEEDGKMHACGHDGHVAIGLTVAKILTNHRDELAGRVKLVFQPAEEGAGGGAAMVKEGVLLNPSPKNCLALHLWNERPVGWMGFSPGPVMAGADFFVVRIEGKGGHGALPQTTIDPITAAAHWISAIQTIVSRNVSPHKTAVVSVTQVKGGDSFNIIPPFVEVQGTIRTFEAEVRQLVMERFDQLLYGICGAMGCSAQVEFSFHTPAVRNDAELTQKLQDMIPAVLPGSRLDTRFQTMVSEDMAFMMQDVPSCYFFVGSANPEKGLNYSHHHPKFDFDEEALIRGSAMMAAAAINLLEE